MGGQPWGGQDVPGTLQNSFAAFAGLDAYPASGLDFAPSFGKVAGNLGNANPIFPIYNLKEEMKRLWYLAYESVSNPSFADDDGGGHLDKWLVNGSPIADGVPTSGWLWDDVTGSVSHVANGDDAELYQVQGSQVRPIEHGVTYRVSITISDRGAGSVKIKLGDGAAGLGTVRDSNGTFTEDITADLETNLWIAFAPTTGFDGHIEEVHITSLVDSPYGLAVLHDPNVDVDAADARYATFDATITAMNPATDWHDDAVAAEAAVDDHICWIADINTIVATYESGKLPELQRSQARFLAQLADVGAIHSTAAFKGLAIMEGEYNRDSGNFRSQAMLIGYQERAKAILQGVSDAQMARRFRIEAGRLSSLVKTELAKFNIVANTDYIKQQLMLDTEAELWNINLLDRVKSVNMISGAPILQRGMSTEQALTSMLFSAAGGVMNMLPMIIK